MFKIYKNTDYKVYKYNHILKKKNILTEIKGWDDMFNDKSWIIFSYFLFGHVFLVS